MTDGTPHDDTDMTSEEFEVALAAAEPAQVENPARRYRDALRQIIAVLGPDNSEHLKEIDKTCPGCAYEISDALRTAMDALAGYRTSYGPGHTKEQWEACRQQRCERCLEWDAGRPQRNAERKAAYEAAGLKLSEHGWDVDHDFDRTYRLVDGEVVELPPVKKGAWDD